MTTFLLIIHSIICVVLVAIVLMQSGRGGGLTESFAAAESMFGAQTDSFLTKSTTVIAVVFFVTCLSLAILSSKKDQSLMANRMATQQEVALPVASTDDTKKAVQELDKAVSQAAETGSK